MKTPINKHSEKTSYKDEEVEVLGEVFAEPIDFQVPPETDMYTRVCIMRGPACLKKVYFAEQMIENGNLHKVVNAIKDNLEKYLS